MTTKAPDLEALQEVFTSRPPRPSLDGCPEPGQLWAAVRGELPVEERRSIVRHTAICAACAEDWRMSWALWREQRRGAAEGHACAEDPDGRVVRGPSSWFRGERGALLAAAAMVVLAVGIGVVLNQPPETHFRGDRSQMMTPPAVPEAQPRQDFVLAWPEGPENATYELQITTADGDVLDSPRNLEEPRFRLDSELLEGVEAGTEVKWTVTVVGPAGEELRRLGPYSTLMVD